MKTGLRFNLMGLTIIVALNTAVMLSVAQSPEDIETARATTAPSGQRYLDTCDGRPTAILGAEDVGCLADYPGEFVQGVFLGASVTLLLLANLGYGLTVAIRARRRNSTGAEDER